MMMKNKSRLCIAILPILTLFCLSSVSVAGLTLTNPTLVFKMTADETSLMPGETTTVHIWAWIYTPAGIEKPNKGLDTWQLDLSVNNTNVISITSLSVLAPNPNHAYPAYQSSSLNNPVTGEVRQVAVSQIVTGAPSLIGVGVDNNIDNAANYSEICSFVIKAAQNPAASSAAYTIMDEGAGWFGILANSAGTTFDNSDNSAYGGTYFYAAGSQHVFTIIPEPASMVLLATAAAFALRRRK
jgi:PEP-CTERM motif